MEDGEGKGGGDREEEGENGVDTSAPAAEHATRHSLQALFPTAQDPQRRASTVKYYPSVHKHLRIYGVESHYDIAYYAQAIPYVLVALLAVTLAPKNAHFYAEMSNSFMRGIFDYLDMLAIWAGLPSSVISHTEWRTLFIEAYVTFVCRAFTDLFVRRLCNPENDVFKVTKQFSLDAVFGALAAVLFVFLRKMGLANLK